MATRKSMTLPIIFTFVILAIIIYLFSSIKQTQVFCEKTTTFDSDVGLIEEVEATMDGKKIAALDVTKIIILPEKYTVDQSYLLDIQKELDRTLEYLGDCVKYTIGEDRIIVKIHVEKNELILLDNIQFTSHNGLQIKINSNTKSSDVIALSVGDNYTEGELMIRMKNDGYSCK